MTERLKQELALLRTVFPDIEFHEVENEGELRLILTERRTAFPHEHVWIAIATHGEKNVISFKKGDAGEYQHCLVVCC